MTRKNFGKLFGISYRMIVTLEIPPLLNSTHGQNVYCFTVVKKLNVSTVIFVQFVI